MKMLTSFFRKFFRKIFKFMKKNHKLLYYLLFTILGFLFIYAFYKGFLYYVGYGLKGMSKIVKVIHHPVKSNIQINSVIETRTTFFQRVKALFCVPSNNSNANPSSSSNNTSTSGPSSSQNEKSSAQNDDNVFSSVMMSSNEYQKEINGLSDSRRASLTERALLAVQRLFNERNRSKFTQEVNTVFDSETLKNTELNKQMDTFGSIDLKNVGKKVKFNETPTITLIDNTKFTSGLINYYASNFKSEESKFQFQKYMKMDISEFPLDVLEEAKNTLRQQELENPDIPFDDSNLLFICARLMQKKNKK
jgi:hypothetical protein